jgi:hypothetical protein
MRIKFMRRDSYSDRTCILARRLSKFHPLGVKCWEGLEVEDSWNSCCSIQESQVLQAEIVGEGSCEICFCIGEEVTVACCCLIGCVTMIVSLLNFSS